MRRFENFEIIGIESFKKYEGLPPEDCQDACSFDKTCKTAKYNRLTADCELSHVTFEDAVTSIGQQVLVKYDPNFVTYATCKEGMKYILQMYDRLLFIYQPQSESITMYTYS